MDLPRWLGFLGLSTLAVLTPGPTLLAVVGHAAGSGFRRTVPVVLGNALGIATVIAVSIAGLGGALLRAPAFLAALQLAGRAISQRTGRGPGGTARRRCRPRRNAPGPGPSRAGSSSSGPTRRR